MIHNLQTAKKLRKSNKVYLSENACEKRFKTVLQSSDIQNNTKLKMPLISQMPSSTF